MADPPAVAPPPAAPLPLEAGGDRAAIAARGRLRAGHAGRASQRQVRGGSSTGRCRAAATRPAAVAARGIEC